MRRLATILLLLATLAGISRAESFPSFPSFPGAGAATRQFDADTWWFRGLTFYAPFDDPASPLRLLRGTGTLTFTRATTATYVHPGTGLVTVASAGQLRIETRGAFFEAARLYTIPPVGLLTV